LFFIVFDVEIALLYPWAVVYRSLGWFAFLELLFFLVPVLVGYAYLLRYGYLHWVRQTEGPRVPAPSLQPPPAPRPAT
jgi:NADH:ubiquinone oxidoreductase subunit 3 (subunit A)